jgi:ribosomal protein S12 methylthiotransferase accessory factor
MVYIPYYYRPEEEPPIAQPISTGLACHGSYEEAAIAAICEVIERDAFTITWQAQLSMPHILLETLSENNRDLVNRFRRTGYAVTLLNLSFDHGIPVILGVLQSNVPDVPALVFAASSHLDPEIAVQKSLEELAHTRRLAEDLHSSLPPIEGSRHHEDCIKSQANHVHFYCDHSNANVANFIFASKQKVDFQTIKNLDRNNPAKNLNTLIDQIGQTHHMILLADLTTTDVEDLGLKVVRAVIPGYHPLVMGHRLRALGGKRLWTIPQKLGFKGITTEIGDNPYAHPYP